MPFVSGWTLMDLVANSAFNVNIDGQPIVPVRAVLTKRKAHSHRSEQVEADAKASTYDPRKHQDAIVRTEPIIIMSKLTSAVDPSSRSNSLPSLSKHRPRRYRRGKGQYVTAV
jgi:hypothetical protein